MLALQYKFQTNDILFWLFSIFYLHFFVDCSVINYHNNCGLERQVLSATYGVLKNIVDGNIDCEWLIKTNRSHQLYINFRLISFDHLCTSETLYLFDGHSYESQLVASFNGLSDFEPVIASSGHLLILQYSDSNLPANVSSFVAEYSITECPLNCSNHGTCESNQCICDHLWSGEACNVPLCPSNCSLSGQCIQAPITDFCNTVSPFYCECMPDYIGQACDVVKNDREQRDEWFHWRVLFADQHLFSSRASHASVFDPVTDTIYTFGGRNHETVHGDLLSYCVSSNNWYNLTNCDTSNSLNSAFPKPRWGHTLSIHNNLLILFGGLSPSRTILNELWTYDLLQNRWLLRATTSNLKLPGLVFHVTVIVDFEWLYVHGGQLENGTHSASIYRINVAGDMKQWQLITPRNSPQTYLRHLSGHSAVFSDTLRSIVLVGGISDLSESQAQFSNSLHLFHVDQNVWSTIHFLPNDHVPIGRAFHSMLLVGDYLFLFGGHTTLQQTPQKLCHDNRMYLYCLTCHQWIDVEHFVAAFASTNTSKNRFPLSGLVSHTFVWRKNQLFVLGGYLGTVRSQVFVAPFPSSLLTLPRSDLCMMVKTKWVCNSLPSCYWCGEAYSAADKQMSHCLHYEQTCPVEVYQSESHCSGLCHYLTDCYSCLAYSTLSTERTCIWDSRELKCISSQSNLTSLHYFLYESSECKQHNIQAGIVLLQYYYPQNWSFPDHITFLSQSYSETLFRDRLTRNLLRENGFNYSMLNSNVFNVARILGFVHPLEENQNSLRLYLGSTSSRASLRVNQTEFNLQSIPSIKPYYNYYTDLPVNVSISNFLVDFIVNFTIRPVSTSLEYDKIQITWKEYVGSTLTLLTSDNLIPFGDPSQCLWMKTCSGCLANVACAWCVTEERCVEKGNLSSQCLTDTWFPVVVDPQHCEQCEQHVHCAKCASSMNCEWLDSDELCIRRGRFTTAIRHIEFCSSSCHQRTSCESCLDQSNRCMWCHAIEACIQVGSKHSASLFEFCRPLQQLPYRNHYLETLGINHSSLQCHQCFRHSLCSLCHTDPNCAWCHSPTDPQHGFCVAKIDSKCSTNLPLNETEMILLNGTCPLVNECQLGMHNCHENSECIDTEDAFRCMCQSGFTGNGVTCFRTCNITCIHGYCSEFPDYHCVCDLGWTGDDCSVDCECHHHSTCKTKVGVCDLCEEHTTGYHCHLCSPGSFGNATDSSKGCQLCQCNGHGNLSRGECHPQTGLCFCKDHTEGTQCERCIDGYYGNPRNGNYCYLECQHRALVWKINSTGYFGSYIHQVHFSRHGSVNLNNYYSDSNLHCLWIFTSLKSRSFGSLLIDDLKTITTESEPLSPIALTFFKSAQLNCSLSSIIVYDGLPYFISASNLTKSTILGSFCEISKDVELFAMSGFATVIFITYDFYQGFNASFRTLSESTHQINKIVHYKDYSTLSNVSSIHLFSTSSPDQSLLEMMWSVHVDRKDKLEMNSWPRMAHTLHYLSGHLIFVGGQLDSHYLPVSLFDLGTFHWSPFTHLPERELPLNRHFHATTVASGKLYLYGGLNHASNVVLGDFFCATIVNQSSQITLIWQQINTSLVDIPPLIGHSLTTIKINNKKGFLLVGGYSPSNGFLENPYIYLFDSPTWKMLKTNGASPVGLLAHSTVFHLKTESIYIFGGIDFKESQKSTISNTLYILNLKSNVWHRVQPSQESRLHFVLPRYLHMTVTTEDYLLVLGGRTHHHEPERQTQILYAYRYQCGAWLALNNSLWDSYQASLNILSATSHNGILYFYQNETVNAVQLPLNLCFFYSANFNICLSTPGCSYCFNESGFCYPSDKPEQCSLHKSTQGTQCPFPRTRCNQYSNCVDCTVHNYQASDETSCQWCADCHHSKGHCIPINSTCDLDLLDTNLTLSHEDSYCPNISIVHTPNCPLRKCFATDCDKCMLYSQTQTISPLHDLPICIWTRQVNKFIRYGHTMNMNPIFDWACIESSIIDMTVPEPILESVPPLSCPARCHRHQTCALCLDSATGDESGSHECVWSELTQECMSPTYAQLRCEHGLCGGILHRQLHSQCPLNCETYERASDCLATLHCGWCAVQGFAIDGVGLCVKGGISGPLETNLCSNQSASLINRFEKKPFFQTIPSFAAFWHYFNLPKENECLNGHHTCDLVSQECVDLEDGFMCRCKLGYRMLENVCKPICHQGCIFGVCVAPNTCRCTFGYIGEDCSMECQCNGHSTCAGQERLLECNQCHNNTQGRHCEQCRPFFVGDPRNRGSCQSCYDYCHTHSNLCFSEHFFETNSSLSFLTMDDSDWWQIGHELKKGPRDKAICVNCKNNTEGERCDRCKLGYFKISDDVRDGCRPCMCNGHGFLCYPFNGENCNCHNNTENDRQCNYLNAKEYSNYINKTYYIKSSQIMATYSLPCWMLQCSKCKDHFHGYPTNGHQCYRIMAIDKEYCIDAHSQEDCSHRPQPLLHGRTVFFGVHPRYMNVDIKIIVYSVVGNIDLYLTSKDDMFVIKVNETNGLHHTFIDSKYLQNNYNSSIYTPIEQWNNFSDDQANYFALDLEDMISPSDIPLRSPMSIHIYDLKNQLTFYYTMKSLNEVVIFRNIQSRLEITIPYRMQDLRTTRFYFMLRGNNISEDLAIDGSVGYLLFRQDQCRIDLFVFFCVFFACFFLFVCISVLFWKVKHLIDLRRAQHAQEIELEHMASRPFAKIYISLENADFQKVPFTGGSLPGTPAKKMSLLRQLTIGFKDSPKIYPEGAIMKQSSGLSSVASPKVKAVSVEPTADGLAAIFTTLVQLPGDCLAPAPIAAASALVSTRHSSHLTPHHYSNR